MRLLSLTSSGTLTLTEFFGDDIPRYAILSHTWGNEGEEVTFGDLTRDAGQSKADLVGYKKIMFCGQQARRHGITYFWVDTCCIDKSSSAELSEAINSMFRWYSVAAKSFVYLSDVSIHDYEDTFSKCRWFTRGWTLQELLASKEAEFFSHETEWLGTKTSLEQQIHETTGITIRAIRGDPLSQFSVKERISWAQNRTTKREEDKAYCLLGIFDISMPLIYGEGKEKALLRLHRLIDVPSKGASYFNIQRWLSPAEVQDDLHFHESRCMSGSCVWALDTPGAQSFLRSGTNEILRIGGDPGSGKSTLAAFMIRHLKETTTGDVIYFFCKETDEKRNKPAQVRRTLISQLLSKDEFLYPSFEKLHMHSGRDVVESFAELQDYYHLALENTLRQTLHIVVDALDECQEGPQLVSSLIKSLGATKGIVKLILTCRNEPELLSAFCHGHYELITSPAQVARPIWNYVRNRVSKNKYISATPLGFEVLNKVSSAADGSWLYARLMMDEIQRLPSAASVQRQLKNIPNGLAQVYMQIFATMEQSLSPLELRLSQQIFLWVDLSDFVAFGRNALNREVLDLVLQAENSGEEVFNSLDLARQLCSPLITLDQYHRGSIKVSFFHHTAAQFLREYSKQEVSALPIVLKPQALKGLYRGSASVWYFTSSPKSIRLLERLHSDAAAEKGEYFEMTYGLWAAFCFQTSSKTYEQDDMAEVERLINRLTDFILSGGIFLWIEMAIIINYAGGWEVLFDNVLSVINTAEMGAKSSLPILKYFSAVRKQFFEDYAYVISITGPCRRTVDEPAGFQVRPLAAQLLSLGRKWSHLYNVVI